MREQASAAGAVLEACEPVIRGIVAQRLGGSGVTSQDIEDAGEECRRRAPGRFNTGSRGDFAAVILLCEQLGLDIVVLSGGVFQNGLVMHDI